MTQEAHREKPRMSTDSTISNLTQKTVTAVDFVKEPILMHLYWTRVEKRNSEDKILAM